MAQDICVPVGEDGFELWDAISGDALPEVTSARAGAVTEYYRYNRD